MNEPAVPLCSLAAWSAWLTVAGFIVATWASYFAGDDDLTQVLGYTACITSAVAATLSVRRFASRLATLLRLTTGDLTPPESPRVLRRID